MKEPGTQDDPIVAVTTADFYEIVVRGPLNGQTPATKLSTIVKEYLTSCGQDCLCDLSACSMIDSASMSLLIHLHSRAEASGRRLTLRVNPAIMPILVSLAVDDYFNLEK